MSPRLQAIALTATDSILLTRVYGSMQFPPPPPVPYRPTPPRIHRRGKTVGTKNSVPSGRVKEVALAYLQGRYGSMNFSEVGQREQVNGNSLRAAVWKMRKQSQSGSVAA